MPSAGTQNPVSRLLSWSVLLCSAAVLLFWHLGRPYLWQDEAATAVLAQRMLRFGRPLAYDGLNLITIDHSAAEDVKNVDQRTRDPQTAITFYIQRGDLKKDTAWKWQPWGQFVVAAASLKLFGETTFAARMPFAIAAVMTVLLLFEFALRHFENRRLAILACAFLISNSYWILHSRQCRYYVLSSMFLMLTLTAYAYWQRGGRAGALMFVTAAWCWFQVDYGTVWPVLAILFLDAFIADRRRFWRPLLVGTVLALTIAPFLYYYELWGRLSIQDGTWSQRFLLNLFNANEYVVPVVVGTAAIAILVYRRRTLPFLDKRLVGIVCAIFVALLFWIPSVAPAPFLRYLIAVAPLGCLLVAWVFIRLGERSFRGFAWAAAVIYVATPWLGLPLHALPIRQRDASLFRPELSALGRDVFGHPADPNGPVIEWLERNAKTSDEILINYEDIPLMFYLPNPIRGGIAAFRAEDDQKRPPDFVVLRRSADFGHWPVYAREMKRYSWEPIPINAPDIICGICADPIAQEHRDAGYDAYHAAPIFIGRRVSGGDQR
jgi:hypothetical protein